MNLAGETNIGEVRQSNQDCFAHRSLSSQLCYAVVCDGMGGESGGQVASTLALEAIRSTFSERLTPLTREDEMHEILSEALSAANTAVFMRAGSEPTLRGMGTTAVAAIVRGDTAYLGNVGDSRAYRFDGAALRQLTKDHTVVQMLIDKGSITPVEALTHPQRNYITRAVGVGKTLLPDLTVERLGAGESLLLCSDGLYNYLPEPELVELLGRCVAENTVAPLIQRANQNGGGDNITAVLVSGLDIGGNAHG